ncbi:unnamed protein product [Brachionus calyciflorus]|uniref:Endonuclease/exonuclease/phosphatase domain-containing protein n=1 Tax=Brachionus calyciflorus TaxID=104777 RepID=A0A813X4P4_9BILA|nr:unnamed protein product [Brachionus calyciflorus]
MFKILKYEFVNRHIIYIVLNFNNTNIILIGVHLPFYNNKQQSESIYLSSLSIIKGLLNAHSSVDMKLVIGDFNADPHRQNPFDSYLSNFLSETDLTPINLLNVQMIDHTYSKYFHDQPLYKANLDHILIDSKLPCDLECNIIENTINMSDHKAIVLKINCLTSPNYIPETNSLSRTNFRLDLTNDSQSKLYNSILEIKTNQFIKHT